MCGEGEGECSRLVMWLVALRLRERMKTKKQETNTDGWRSRKRAEEEKAAEQTTSNRRRHE